ncbi:uncharacterized protein cubi_01535 [Cryptosporidium ubiquitum]|uniref:Uncharacterized protein n=1 Tax=Cryptosporidium ubiquitum TaxID=857276 RepID=A0A1J4MD81_9CRYT|nr:uncharacterized protein cubi_01535 [Cryptosporidium ubiquitum]OII72202.1 hypothetical protein cubi_01535 [Cryptosporidium ubiquitum]
MRLESLFIFSIFILLIVNSACFATNVGFNSFSPVSYVQQNQQRLSALTSYKRRIEEYNRKIFRLKKLISKIIQTQKDNAQSGFNINSNSKTNKTLDKLCDSDINSSKGSDDVNISGNDELERKLTEVVISLLDEQTKFTNMFLRRMIIFWNPNFNFGVDISSKVEVERGFLDMLGLGDKSLWSGSNCGGKLIGATDSEDRIQESIPKLIDLAQLYRFSMVYNYIHIIGSIYRHTKNFDRTVRSRLRLFKNMRERLIKTRDSLALTLNTDLPNDVDLPYPRSPPSYLNVGENCNEDIYRQISKEIAFFKKVQDENRELSVRIRDGPCRNHEVTGCTFCEIKKVCLSLIEWAFNDIQADLIRLDRDLKLCIDSIQRNGGVNAPPDAMFKSEESSDLSSSEILDESGESIFSYECDEQDNSQEEMTLTSNTYEDGLEGSEESLGTFTQINPTSKHSDIKRYKRRSSHHRTSRTSKRRGIKSRRTNMSWKLKSLEADPLSKNDNKESSNGTNCPQNNETQITGSKSNDYSASTSVNDDINSNSKLNTSLDIQQSRDSKRITSGEDWRHANEASRSKVYSPSYGFSDSESESENDPDTPIDTTSNSHNTEFSNSVVRRNIGNCENKRNIPSANVGISRTSETIDTHSRRTRLTKRRRSRRK